MFGLLRKALGTPAAPKAPPKRKLAIDYFRVPDAPAPANPDPAIRPADYFDPSTQRFRPVHPTELLNVHVDLVQQIYQDSGMTRTEFANGLYPVLEYCAAAYQLCPASMSHHHREPGGLFLHSMQVCRHAVHLGQFSRFERDRSRPVSPIDKKYWSVALAFAALTHDCGKPLTDFRVVHPTFFAPGRLLPPLDDGPPPEDEPALFSPFNDTIYGWLERRGYAEYQIRWLSDRFAKHQRPAPTLMTRWESAAKFDWLPEKIRSTLGTYAPIEGSIEADFWEVINQADQRSTTLYFPAVGSTPSAIIVETLRLLVSEGRWAPSADRFPLRVGTNQRLLLLDPTDLTQLAKEISTHPQGYALASRGQLSANKLASDMKFGCLLEVDNSGQMQFGAAVAGATLPPNQTVLVLNERLSSELINLARSAPSRATVAPAATDAATSSTGPQPSASAPRTLPLDLSALADPIPRAAQPAASNAHSQATTSGSASVSASQPANPPPTTQTPLIELPPLVFKFLEDVQSLNPYAIHTADKTGQPRPSKKDTPDHIQIDLNLKSGIRIGRLLIQRFAKAHAYPLDTVFSTLIACPEVISQAEPSPPQPTMWVTMSLPASKAVYNQTLSKFARAVSDPSHSVRRTKPPAPLTPARALKPDATPPSGPVPPAPDFTSSLHELRATPPTPATDPTPASYLHALLFRLLSHPHVSCHFSDASTKVLFVDIGVLGEVLDQARLDGIEEAAGLDPLVLARQFHAVGFPVEVHLDGVLLTEEIAPYWVSCRTGAPLP